jgi:uncharacterized protein YggE
MLARIAVLIALAGIPVPAGAQQFQPNPPPTLQANGEGEVMVTPDLAIVTVGVTTRAPTAGAALAANAADLQQVVAAIKAAGVEERDIGTAGFHITPVYPVRPNPQPNDPPLTISGYAVENTVRVTIRNVATSGAILDRVVQAGANRVSGIQFDLSDRKVFEDTAIKAAIGEARRRAQIMADAAGVTLGKMTSVTASAGGGGPVPYLARADFAAATPVLPGQQTVTASASITWEIAPR